MEDTSWISGIFANPFLRGLLVGLFIALVLWIIYAGTKNSGDLCVR